jgi:two-component system sensor histidine kinase RegB
MRRGTPLPWLLPTASDEGRIWLTWLVRLRWLALFAQAVTLAFVFNLLHGVEPIVVWCVTMGFLVGANLWSVGRLALGDAIQPHSLLLHLLVDVVALTAFFAIGDGPANPFTPLYLVHVAMGAVILPPRYAGAVALFVVVAYSTLFAGHLPLHYENHSLPEGMLVRLGQGLAFGITSLSVSVFVVGLAASLRRHKEQLFEARDRTARTDRLRSVGTLAAGAAHELNTPLSTMSLRLGRIRRRHRDEDTARDVEVIASQLERCTSIVGRLLFGAGDPSASGMERRALGAMVDEAVRMWSKGTLQGARIEDLSEGFEVELPNIAFQQALINLLENAREAQESVGSFDPIEIRVLRDGDRGTVELADRGVGLPENADQIGEPFFTTKASGTGLGVFVARAVADGAGGGLQYRAREGAGVVAQWWFPEARRRAG